MWVLLFAGCSEYALNGPEDALGAGAGQAADAEDAGQPNDTPDGSGLDETAQPDPWETPDFWEPPPGADVPSDDPDDSDDSGEPEGDGPLPGVSDWDGTPDQDLPDREPPSTGTPPWDSAPPVEGGKPFPPGEYDDDDVPSWEGPLGDDEDGDDDLPWWEGPLDDDEDSESEDSPDDEVEQFSGRMTGGGSIQDGVFFTYGMTLHCDGSHHANSLQVNGAGLGFHLEEVDWVLCSDDPALTAGQPQTAHDTVEGVAWGHLDQRPARIWFRFADDGEPGIRDEAEWVIDDGTVYIVASGQLLGGNNQTHGAVH